jgi:hypothetical protein
LADGFRWRSTHPTGCVSVVEMQMNKQSDREFQRKAYLDLWLHQNQLFWSRFQLLYIIQGAFFVVVSTIRSEKPLINIALGITLVFMAWLYSTLDQDRRLRNSHARILKVKFGFDPLPSKITTPKRLSTQFTEVTFQLCIFIPFAIIDIFAACYWVTSIPKSFVESAPG